MGRIEILSQALQKKTLDIVNAIEVVSTTKTSLNDFRNDSWDSLLEKVMSFSEKHQIEIPDMKALYKSTCYRPRRQDNQELDNRFNENAMELLTLGSSLLRSKELRCQRTRSLKDVSTLAQLCTDLAKTNKCEQYYLIDRLIKLILTLPFSTATTERGFSAMKVIKNRLRNKMSDDFLASNLVVYIEKEIVETFDSKSVIDDFKNLKGRRAEL
ncbi:uncharacterized protein [Rutidosis leptorrhynchoides]|uniref:uncharacterized protein n=1 Tax=Rutidosis leptorrhynchoides TaxID=125765 RepID=UPI003A9A55EA